MEVECLSSDIISALPQDIIKNILSRLPIRDAVKTSILSKKWRHCWAKVPTLVFDDNMFEGSSYDKQIMKHKLVNAIFQVLLLHTSPLVDLTLSIELEMVSEIDQIILYLSRSNTLKRFKLENRSSYHYKLPSSFFSLQGLEYLELCDCDLELPLIFNGFSNLSCLNLYNVEITAMMLKRFLTNCPQLENFYLIGQQKDFTRGNKFTFVELFECLPSVVLLAISEYYIEFFAEGGMPEKLSTPLTHLKQLYLGVCFMNHGDLSATLCLIKSSPNLERILLKLGADIQTTTDLVNLQDHSGFKLNHLEELVLVAFNNLAIEIKFLNLVLASSPVLKKVRIVLNANISNDEEVRILRDFIRLPLPRASPSATVIIERPETST